MLSAEGVKYDENHKRNAPEDDSRCITPKKTKIAPIINFIFF